MVIDTKIMRFMKAAKVICSKNTVNKVTGVAYNNQMIAATNCNAQLTYTSDEDRKDTIYLPVKAIDYIMSFGKGSKIDFKVEGRVCKISSGRSHTQFALLTEDALPSMGRIEIDNIKPIRLSAEAISLLKNVNTAPTNKSGKPAAQGISIRTENDNVVAYGTDGTKMAYAILAEDTIQNIDINLHKDTLSLILSTSLFDEGVDIVSADNNRKLVLTSIDGIRLIVSQYDYNGLDAKSIINTIDKSNKKISLNKNDLFNICKRADLLGDKKTIYEIARMQISKDTLTIKWRGATSSLSEYIPIKNYSSGDDIEIGVNINLLATALSCMNTDIIEIHHGNSLSAYYLTDGKIDYMIMPVRLGNSL